MKRMRIWVGLAIILATVLGMAACKGEDDVRALAEREGLLDGKQGLVAVSAGKTVLLYETKGNSLSLLDQASLMDTAVDYPCCDWDGVSTYLRPWATDPEFMIYGMVVHPTRPWLYVFSNSSNWDPSRIDRFEIDQFGRITHKGLAFRWSAADAPVSPSCGTDLNGCPMVSGVFSPDGSRLYSREDSGDSLVFFDVNLSTGMLTPTVHYTTTRQYMWGMRLHPGNPNILYGGWMTWDISSGTPALLNGADFPQGGNGTLIRNIGGTNLLFTTDESNRTVNVLSLAVPQTPAMWATSAQVFNGFHHILWQGATNRIVSSGKNTIGTWDTVLTGPGTSSFTANGTFTPSLAGPGAVTLSYAMHRSGIFWPGDPSRLISPWFGPDSVTGDWYGGMRMLSIAGDGSLAETANIPLSGPARSIVAWVP